ncbi:MAG: hypothetical protein JO020_15085 [Chloroflexi bacterium]|nr:hypothetical protein [Chloroflexota bacterium]MBV9895486.1 hypothetical protein [Chloroflexota bacterium]
MVGSKAISHLACAAALVAATACQSAIPGAGAPPPTDVPTATEVATVPTAEESPTAVPSPTPRPTPLPIPTPVAPSQALTPAAASLDAKLGAFRTALRDQDVNGALKDQRDLLAAANDADTALKSDKSPQAQAVRGAIADIRQAIGGDTNGLDHADAALRQVIGGSTSIAQLTSDTSNSGGVADVRTVAEDVRNLRQAVQSKNAGDALRLQGKLVEEIGPVQKIAGSDTSAQGKALTDALALLQKGLDGDATALATAGDALDKLGGAAGPAESAPDYAGLAASLAAKMDAFSTATSTASQSDLLRLQQEILNEATQDEAALGTDQSAQAVALRNAINAARATASGDLSKLGSARADLGKVSGDAASQGSSSAKPITDIKGFAADLDATIAAFQSALQKNDTGSMLRLQKTLADQADQAETSLKGVQSTPAQQVLTAVDAIRAAFAGDTNKLADARVALRPVAAGAPAGTVPGTAVPSPQTQSTPGPKLDSQQVGGGVVNALTALSQAAQDQHQSPDELAKRRDAVNSEATKAEAALQGVNDPRADQIRSALTAAREAAAGDNAKVQTALDRLQSALASH